jgi:DNA-binding response OmpR family regulator
MRKKILIVEDDQEIQEFLKELLTDNGYETVAAADGLSALHYFKSHNPDLILLDLGIPKLSGEDLAIKIRKINKDVPIIILSARDSKNSINQGLKLGADDYIPKPFMADELLEKIKRKIL